MEYVKPNYEIEEIEVVDVILGSSGSGGGTDAVLTEKDKDSANITTSIFDVL